MPEASLMGNTLNYYSENAELFFQSTVGVDSSPLYREFLPLLPSNAFILDAGCGSGRDAKAFIELGYSVHAFDASEELVKLASTYTGLNVEHTTFSDFTTSYHYDGIWACASLLHISLSELAPTISHLSDYLKQNGYFYASFKLGSREHVRNGRLFTDLNEDSFIKVLSSTPLSMYKSWVTSDLRSGRENEHWLNAIFKKE